MSQAQTVTATFAHGLQELDVDSQGPGTITSSPSGIDCPPDNSCFGVYAVGTGVTLTATPATGYVFAGWSGDCSGAGACALTMDQTHRVDAMFELPPETLTVTKLGTGSGTVTSVAAGIDCGSTCEHGFTQGTTVTLTETPAPGSQFDGWSGGPCYTGGSPVDTCEVVLDVPKTVEVRFTTIICDVPDLKPLDLADAKAVLRQQHCTVGKIRKEPSKKVKKGMVISQSPGAGKHLPNGAPVNLVVSSGKPRAKR